MNTTAGVVYVIQFSRPIAGHANFYCGSTAAARLGERFREHTSGYGAKLTRAALQQGIGMRIFYTVQTPTLKDARLLEKKIKHGYKSTPRWLKAQGVQL